MEVFVYVLCSPAAGRMYVCVHEPERMSAHGCVRVGVWVCAQVEALVEVMLQLPMVKCVVLAANHLDDGALAELCGGFLATPAGGGLEALDVSNNLLTAGAVMQLVPLLKLETSSHVSEAPAA